MPRKETVGTGITKQTRIMYDVTGNTPGDKDGAKAAFRRIGREIGEKGLWGANSDAIRQTCDSILQGKDINGDFEADSPECFARRIRQLLKIVDNSLEEGGGEIAASLALQAGALWATAKMKWNWEDDALRGQNQISRLDTGRTNSKTNRRENMQPRLDAITEILQQKKGLTGGALENYIRRRLQDEAGITISLRTIRRDIAEIRSTQK